ncbi:hypothetical protein ACVWXU_001193 [Streptomyces sp. TE33382]
MWDVAVIGAGVGGCHLSYRLLDGTAPGSRPLRVALFEATGRLDGRLWSAPMPGLAAAVADYGGMRYDGSEHHVVDLVGHLGLSGDAEPFHFDRPENLVHARGIRLRQRDLHGPTATPPYRTAPHERGLDASGLSLLVATSVLPEFAVLRERYGHACADGDPDALAEAVVGYRATRRTTLWRGRRLHEIAWSEAVDTLLTPEAAAMLHDTGGYNSRTSAEAPPAHWTPCSNPPRPGPTSGSGKGSSNSPSPSTDASRPRAAPHSWGTG